MDDNGFTIPATAQGVDFTGERYVPGVSGQIRTEHIHRYLFASQFVRGRDVLDVACGEGYGSQILAQHAKSVIGVDIAANVIERATEVYGSETVAFRVGDATKIPVEDDSIDVVVCFETIEHVANQGQVLSEVRRVLRRDGLLVISTPNALANDHAWHENNPFHVHELSREEFSDLLQSWFPYVSVGEQRALHGSIISFVAHGPHPGEPEEFNTSDGITYTRQRGSLGDYYFVAIASKMDISCSPLSIQNDEYELHKLEDEFRYAVSRMHHLEEHIDPVEAAAPELEALRTQLDSLHLPLKSLVAALGEDGTIDGNLQLENDDLATVLSYIRSQQAGIALIRARYAWLAAKAKQE